MALEKVKGEEVYVKINTGPEEPVWTMLGGQKDCTIDRGAASRDITNKQSAGWEENMPGRRNWSISFDAFLIEDDPGFEELERAFDANEQDLFQIITPLHVYEGTATIEGLSITGPDGDVSVVSFSLKGTGALVKT